MTRKNRNQLKSELKDYKVLSEEIILLQKQIDCLSECFNFMDLKFNRTLRELNKLKEMKEK